MTLALRSVTRDVVAKYVERSIHRIYLAEPINDDHKIFDVSKNLIGLKKIYSENFQTKSGFNDDNP